MIPLAPNHAAAARDWWNGTLKAELWWTLAWYDILLRYRRSLLGPLWLTISMGMLLIGMGPLYAFLFRVPLERFFPHLALGIIFWTFLTSTLLDGCNVFIGAAPYLKQSDSPGSVFVWRTLARNLIQLAHHLILYVPVAIWAGLAWSPRMLFFLPGMILLLVNLHAAMITLGIACARFRDLILVVTSLFQLLLFLTPVFWFPESLPDRARFVLYNPLAQLLDVVRMPLLGAAVASGTWWFLLYLTLLNVAVAALLYLTKRQQLVYWI